MKNECAGYKTLNPSRGHITTNAQIYKNVILVSRITKMSLWAKNVGPMKWTGSLT